MTSAKVAMFLRESDRAYARGDGGIVRSMNVELRRLGVPDDATLANPAGRSRKPSQTVSEPEVAVLEVEPSIPDEEPRNKGGRPKLPRCEHGNVADRCPDCNEELLAE